MTKKTKILLYTLSFILIFSAGFFYGMNQGVKNTLFNNSGELEISKVLNLYSNNRKDYVDFEQFWQIWDKIHEKYVEPENIDNSKLFYSSIEGLIAGLEDEHSMYFSPEKARDFSQSLSGEFEGIGAELTIKNNKLTVVAPLPDSPAEKAGIKSGDVILYVDDEDIFGLSVEESVLKIKGEKGTKVKLKISRNDEIFDVEIIRDVLNLPTVYFEEKQSGVFYLRISNFNEKTWEEFDKGVKKILAQNNVKAIILDLRLNPGGYFDSAVKIASEWIENGVIVSEKFNDQKQVVYESVGNHRLKNIKTVVLIDEGSASSAEILAGALKDNNKATIIGKKSFGKGTVQEFEILPDGSALKLTVAKWFTPKSIEIEGVGIEPDILIDEMIVQKEGTSGENADDYVDVGLERAMELLN